MERIENKIEKRNDKKNLKKKVLMVAGLALLLGFVGYTGGTTYARYVASTEVPSTTATVAKWGYVVNSNAANLWGDDYAYNTSASVVTSSTTGLTVSDSADENVVAPGTTGHVLLNIEGTAEVLSSISIESTINDIYLDNDDNVGNGRYYPVKWTITGNATIQEVGAALPTNLLDGKTLSGTGATVAKTLEDLSQAKINPNTVVDINLTISWAWEYSVIGNTEILDTFTSDPADYLSVDHADTVLANGGKYYNDASSSLVGNYKLDTEASFLLSASVTQLAE